MAKYKFNNREINKIYDSLYRKVYEFSYPWMMAPSKSSVQKQALENLKFIMENNHISLEVADHKELFLLVAIFINYIDKLNSNNEYNQIIEFIDEFMSNIIPQLNYSATILKKFKKELLFQALKINDRISDSQIIEDIINEFDEDNENKANKTDSNENSDFTIEYSEDQINNFYLSIIDQSLESAIRKKLAQHSNAVPYKVNIDKNIRNKMLKIVRESLG